MFVVMTTSHANQQISSISEHSIYSEKKGARYALLVGVSDYPSLEQDYQLVGPKNDVILMQRVLLAKGFKLEHIKILASDMLGAVEPTKKSL